MKDEVNTGSIRFHPSSFRLHPLTWRRGWDSNPRNGFPFTAFPVLPVQSLLHLSSIANWQSKIGNQCWRRGWDSNPRWALTHSGFRDRCTNPLCDLSASLFCSSAPEKFLHECAAFRLQHSRTDPDPVIQEIRVADAKATHDCSRSLIRRAVDQTTHTRLYQSSRAHRTRLDRRINIHAGEPVISKLTGGFAKSNDFSVGCRIAVGTRAVSGKSDEFVFANDAGADWHFAIRLRFSSSGQAEPHPVLVKL